MEIDYTWDYLSNLFASAVELLTETKTYTSDRKVKFQSKQLIHFSTTRFDLLKGKLPDLRFQEVNISTAIETQVQNFLKGNEFLGLLIGPTGCGKTHQLFNTAKKNFTIFIDAAVYPASNDPNDTSLSALRNSFESEVCQWTYPNQNLSILRRICYAFVLSRILFLEFLLSKNSSLTPTEFLINQLVNSLCILNCFNNLKSLSIEKLQKLRSEFFKREDVIFCVDEAHVLLDHLGTDIISSTGGNHIQHNGDVNDSARRGTLSVLLHAIKDGQFAKKIIFAGTSRKLRNIDNFGTFGTKPVAPTPLTAFRPWNSDMALKYVSSLVKIDAEDLKNILTDNYRPRILENFIYDLFSIGMNDAESPTGTMDTRIASRDHSVSLDAILKESYGACLRRFNRVTITPLADLIRHNGHLKTLLRLLLSSMMTCKGTGLLVSLDENEVNYFNDTIGAVYLIGGIDGYSFYEGYVIDAFLVVFSKDLHAFQLQDALNLLKAVIRSEGKKCTAKGTPFEAVVLADLMQNRQGIREILSNFGITCDLQLNFPTGQVVKSDAEIITGRPLNVFLRPSNLFRPDLLVFGEGNVCLSFGIKLYTSPIRAGIHDDNLLSTDPQKFFEKNDRVTHSEMHSLWKASLQSQPIAFAVRFLIELPGVAPSEPFQSISYENGVIVMVNNDNMHYLLSENVQRLIKFIISK